MTDLIFHETGGRLVQAPREDFCLAFANTRYWRGSAEPTEALGSFADVVAWCEGAKLLDRASAVGLQQWGARRNGEAAALFEEVIAARETIYRLFSATASGGAVIDADVEMLNRQLEQAPGRAGVTIAEAGNMWRLPPATATSASLLAPVLWSAGDLLVGDRLASVRLCANEKCRWLFLDDSKSGTRRWCSMSSCGNRAKAHRHYLRRAQSGEKTVSKRSPG
jgi:predicted RNA-binding Zn ribbon-like protein